MNEDVKKLTKEEIEAIKKDAEKSDRHTISHMSDKEVYKEEQ